MENTLQIGDHILVNKFIYGVKIPFFKDPMISVKEPVHGDIIVFKFPKDPSLDYIKRVIAVGGEFGTLSEIAFALKLGRPVIGLGTWELAKDGQPAQAVVRAQTAEEAVRLALGAISG